MNCKNYYDIHVYSKAITYLNRLLKQKPLTSQQEIREVKEIKEQLNSMMYAKNDIRSKDANSFLWSLCTEIGNKLRISKENVYLNMLKSYGQSIKLPVVHGEEPYHITKYYEMIGTSKLNGKDADWYIFYKGSSQYNKKEMAILLDGVIQECANLEIPTIKDEELERMKGSWNNE